MTPLSVMAAKYLILLTQFHPFRGEGSYACRASASETAPAAFPQAEQEAARFNEFFSFFRMSEVGKWFQGKHVLDLGSGYGGRTVEYVRRFGVADISGIEVFPSMVELSNAYARSTGIENCRFILGEQLHIHQESESLDAVVSYDVLEHVSDPCATMREVHRILKKGGRFFLVFTPYHGMLSHHLTYITKLPCIHWIFRPETLIEAINAILVTPGGRRFRTVPQPRPAYAHNGKRTVLPTLNGLTSEEFTDLLDGFEIIEMNQPAILSRYPVLGKPGAEMNRLLMKISPLFRDAFSFNLSCILQKRG